MHVHPGIWFVFLQCFLQLFVFTDPSSCFAACLQLFFSAVFLQFSAVCCSCFNNRFAVCFLLFFTVVSAVFSVYFAVFLKRKGP